MNESNERGRVRDQHEAWTRRLSEYLDGGLDAAEVRRVEAHLGSCDDCRAVLSDLSAVVDAAGNLEATEPARDLWPGIREAIGAEGSPTVVRFPVERRPWARRVSLTLPQLAAAAIVLVLGTSLVLQVRGGPGPASNAVAGTQPAAEAMQFVGSIDPSESGGGVAAELRRLEQTLESMRGELDPSTVRILEKNLAIIDRAITESLEALQVDPENAYLEEHLRRAYERKADVLREATTLIGSAD